MSATAASSPPAAIRTLMREFWRRLRRQRLALGSGAVIVLLVFAAVFAPSIAPFDPAAPDYDSVLAGPSALHWLGTDAFGRDILSRLIWGARVSLSVGVLSVALGGFAGVVIGLLSGFFGG